MMMSTVSIDECCTHLTSALVERMGRVDLNEREGKERVGDRPEELEISSRPTAFLLRVIFDKEI